MPEFHSEWVLEETEEMIEQTEQGRRGRKEGIKGGEADVVEWRLEDR